MLCEYDWDNEFVNEREEDLENWVEIEFDGEIDVDNESVSINPLPSKAFVIKESEKDIELENVISFEGESDLVLDVSLNIK